MFTGVSAWVAAAHLCSLHCNAFASSRSAVTTTCRLVCPVFAVIRSNSPGQEGITQRSAEFSRHKFAPSTYLDDRTRPGNWGRVESESTPAANIIAPVVSGGYICCPLPSRRRASAVTALPFTGPSKKSHGAFDGGYRQNLARSFLPTFRLNDRHAPRPASRTIPEYHLNISEEKKFPKALSASVLAMKLRNSSALLRKALWMLRFNLSRSRPSMLLA